MNRILRCMAAVALMLSGCGKDDVCSVMDDPIFKAYCLENFDTDRNGKVSVEEAKTVMEIDCSGSYQTWGEIASLKGGEYFPNLEALYCFYNKLTALDVSKNTVLDRLKCDNNPMSTLYLISGSAYAALEYPDGVNIIYQW